MKETKPGMVDNRTILEFSLASYSMYYLKRFSHKKKFLRKSGASMPQDNPSPVQNELDFRICRL